MKGEIGHPSRGGHARYGALTEAQGIIGNQGDGPGESPLAEGTWRATVCLGEVCSNSVALAVAKH